MLKYFQGCIPVHSDGKENGQIKENVGICGMEFETFCNFALFDDALEAACGEELTEIEERNIVAVFQGFCGGEFIVAVDCP